MRRRPNTRYRSGTYRTTQTRSNTNRNKTNITYQKIDISKRSNRVYVLLIILSFIMAVSLILDMSVTKARDNIQTQPDNNKTVTEVTTQTSTEITTEATTEKAFEDTTSAPLSAEDMTKVNNYYKNTAFVGDSIMLGFSTYVASNNSVPQFLKDSVFLAASSFGVGAANNNKQLMYKGQSVTLLDGLKAVNPDKIFINLGVNELNGVSAEKVGEKYAQLIDKIETALPESDIYILGVTPFVEGKETSTYNNDGINEFNNYLKSNQNNWGVTYLDFPSVFKNSKGYLPAELSSDNRIHHNDKAYKLWVNFFEDLAINGTKNYI